MINENPELTSGASGTVVENLPITTAIYTASATDQDAGHDGNISYSITSNADDDSDKVSILDASTGVVTLNNSADFENQSSYTFEVVATDPLGLTDTKLLQFLLRM